MARMSYADFLVDEECLSRQHAHSCPENGCWSCALADGLAEYDRLMDDAPAHPRRHRRVAGESRRPSVSARTFKL